MQNLPVDKPRSLRLQWRALAWSERFAVAITVTNLLAGIAVASLLAAAGGSLVFFPGAAGGADALITPVALLAGLAMLAPVPPLAALALALATAIWMVLRRVPAGHLLAAAGLTVSGFALLGFERAGPLALRAPIAILWLAGACLGLACSTRLGKRAEP